MNFIIYNRGLYSLEKVKRVSLNLVYTTKHTRNGQKMTAYSQSLTIYYFGGDEASISFEDYNSMEELNKEIDKVFNEICEKLK